jgi:hypothetical protein
MDGDRDRLIEQLVGLTGGFSRADLAFVCHAVKLHALQRGDFLAEVALLPGDFEIAIGGLATRPLD